MTWIKTIRMEEDDGVKNAIEDESKLYPAEYATPVPAVFAGVEQSIVGSHSLFPDVLFHAFSTFGALMSPELPSEAASARNDRHDGVGDEPMPLLNRISRRVSASGSRWIKIWWRR